MGQLSVEPRSFAARRSVGELTPIDLDGLSGPQKMKALSDAIYQTHACVEQVGTKVTSIEGELKGIAIGLNIRPPAPGEEKPKAKVAASWQTRLAAAGGSIAGAAALYQLFHAIWPALEKYLLSK